MGLKLTMTIMYMYCMFTYHCVLCSKLISMYVSPEQHDTDPLMNIQAQYSMALTHPSMTDPLICKCSTQLLLDPKSCDIDVTAAANYGCIATWL